MVVSPVPHRVALTAVPCEFMDRTSGLLEEYCIFTSDMPSKSDETLVVRSIVKSVKSQYLYCDWNWSAA